LERAVLLRKRDDFQEKYQYYTKKLRNEILSGNIKPGEFILPENTLSQEFELSRVSIRKGLAELVEEGLIEKIPGKGNRVVLKENQNKQSIKLAWFSTSYEIEVVKKMIALFEERNPFVKVDLEIYPNDSYAKTILSRIENGYGPDVFILSDYHFRDVAELKGTDLLEEYKPSKFETYDAVTSMFTHQNKQKAVPFVFSPVVICYNKDLIQPKKPVIQTWQDLLHVSKESTIVKNDDIVEAFGFCFSSAPNRWPVFLLQNGGGFRKSGKSVIQQKENIEALQYCVDLMYKHKVSPVFTHGSNQLAENLFMKKRAAMILTTYYFMNEFKDCGFDWDVMELPKQKDAATLLLGGGLGINAESSYKEVAKSLVDFMVSDEAQTMMKKNMCTIPASRKVAENKELINKKIHPDHYHAFIESMNSAVPVKDLELSQAEIINIQYELHLLWANMERPDEVCSRLQHLLDSKTLTSVK
jgi:multiple sugar transport system substrate-binding protein